MATLTIVIIVAVVAIVALLALNAGGGPRVTTIERHTEEKKKDGDDV
jgi:hypothetical protein